jgi:hypothetical protein
MRGSRFILFFGGLLGSAGEAVVVPAAPALTWNSLEADDEPDFLVDLPSGNVDPDEDAAAGDHLIIEYQLQAGGAWTEYVDRTLIAGDITDDTITITGVGSVASGSYYFRARIERGALIGTNSANEEVTIAASGNPPVNTVAPVISGTQQVGQTLSCTTGTWTGDATIVFTYQWKRGGVDIGSATASTYLLVTADGGTNITCNVTGTNGVGNASQISNTLAIQGVPVNSVAPVISGNVQVGQTLTTTDGTWSNSPTSYAYQWKRDGVSIGGATASTRVLAELDAGAAITCEVTASNSAGPGTATASNSLTIDVYVVLVASIVDPANADTYSGGSWNSLALGTAAANRKILVGFASLNTTNAPNVSSSSLGAASGTEVTAEEQATNGLGVWMLEFANTADTSANLSVTHSAAGTLRAGARIFSVYGAGTGTVHHANATSASSVANNSVTTPTNGASISVYSDRALAAPGTITWTNSTAVGTEAALEGTGTTIDAAVDASAGTANISASTSNGSTSFLAMCTVAYGPN